MKTRYFFLFTLTGLLLFSCAKEKEQENELTAETSVPDGYSLVKFSAGLEALKSEINAQGHTVWSEADQIRLFWDGGNGTADLVGGAGSTTGYFEGIVPSDKTVACAVYPSNIEAGLDGATVRIPFPAAQSGTFAAGNIAVAKAGSDNTLSFHNVNSFIAIQLKSNEVSKIEVESISGAALVGNLKVSLSGSAPAVGEIDSPSPRVSMSAGEAGIYYISVLPGVAHDNGLLLKYYKGDDVTGTYVMEKSVTTVRSQIISFGEFEPDGNFFVTLEGAGNKNGLSWANALSKDQMWAMLHIAADDPLKAEKLASINGATFHLGAGVYELAASPVLRFDESEAVVLNFKGDYPAAGGEQDRSGAANRACITGAGTHAALILRGKMKLSFDGIGFINGVGEADEETADTDADNLKIAASLDISGEDLDVSMSHCDVKNNTHADAGKTSDGNWGAGVRLLNVASFVADSVTFAHNYGYASAGLSCRNSKVTLTNCSFFKNTTSGEVAGGLYLAGDTTEAEITGCTFEANAALAKNGGAVSMTSKAAGTFKNCLFKDNVVPNDDNARTSGDGYGGALNLLSNCVVEVIDCVFTGNQAWRGGCIRANSGGSVSFTGCTFKANGNSATTRGGGVAYTEKAATFTNCTFGGPDPSDANNALWGGAIHNVGGLTSVFASTFRNNVALGGGGAICAEKGLQVDYTGDGITYFIDNSVTGTSVDGNGGGAIWAETYKTGTGQNVSIHNAVFKGNHAVTGGAAFVYGKSSGCYFYDCSFGGEQDGEPNYSTGESGNAGGGTLYLRDKSYSSLNNCTIIGDHCARYGGSIFANNSGNLILSLCTFKDCYSSKGWGGAINTTSGSMEQLSVKGCNFIGCHSNCGGAILTRMSSGKLSISQDDNTKEGCVFQGNYADNASAIYCGGALQIEGKSTVSDEDGSSSVRVTIWKAKFIGNYSGNGGAIYAKSGGNPDVYIDRCSFDGNYITKEWGAVMASDGMNRLHINNTTIRNSYTTSTDAARQTGNKPSWIAIYGKPAAFSISNSTIIGDPQYSADGVTFTPLPDGNGLINFGGDAPLYLINNIIAPTTASVAAVYGDVGTEKVDLRYNQYSSVTNVVATDSGGNVDVRTASSFDGLAWTDSCWQWNGTIGGAAPAKITADDFITRLTAINEAYVKWIDTRDDHFDYYGVDRGDGEWWPGAYQAN